MDIPVISFKGGNSDGTKDEVCLLLPPPCPWQANPHNYDAWFDYLRLLESDAEATTVREVYERAIANVPPIQEKRHWKRYIYLWINYALYEELEAKASVDTSGGILFPNGKQLLIF